MGNRQANRPPQGWELQVSVPDFGPDAFDETEGLADIYASEPQTKDGVTFVSGSWNSDTWEPEILVTQDGNEISLPSVWAARKLADLLSAIADEVES